MYLTSMPAYVYKIICKPTGQFYYGYRESNIKLNRLPIDDLWIYYFTHSKLVKDLIIQYGKDSFITEILFQCDPDQAFWKEQNLIKLDWNNPLLLNKQYRDQEKGHKVFRHNEFSQEKRLATRKRKNPNKLTKVRTKLTELEKSNLIRSRVKTRYQNNNYTNYWLAKSYKIVDPNGNEFIITNLAEFCRTNNLTKQAMNAVSKGKQLQHKGWKCYNLP